MDTLIRLAIIHYIVALTGFIVGVIIHRLFPIVTRLVWWLIVILLISGCLFVIGILGKGV